MRACGHAVRRLPRALVLAGGLACALTPCAAAPVPATPHAGRRGAQAPAATLRAARAALDRYTARGVAADLAAAAAGLKPLIHERAPAQVWLLSGVVRQYQQDFPGALLDFNKALQKDPHNAEVHAWKAAVHMVRAEYSRARSECEALHVQKHEVPSIACFSYVEAATGRLGQSYERLSDALQLFPRISPELRLWSLLRLADMAQRLQRPSRAEAHFREALALNIENAYLFAGYADFLLRQERAQEVIDLLQGRDDSDFLLLRLALAEKAAGSPDLARHVDMLKEYYAQAAARGEKGGKREQSRFRLYLLDDADGALRLAEENYRVRREPADAEMLLLAARAAGRPSAARPVFEWLSRSGFEDPHLRALAADVRRAL